MDRILKSALVSLAFNIAFSAYHIVFGVMERSWWLFTVGIYYVILSTARYAVIMTKRNGRFVTKFAGIMLMVLSVPLAGTVVLAVAADRGTVFHEIVMIAIAVYAFTKITLATINFVKVRHIRTAKVVHLRFDAPLLLVILFFVFFYSNCLHRAEVSQMIFYFTS